MCAYTCTYYIVIGYLFSSVTCFRRIMCPIIHSFRVPRHSEDVFMRPQVVEDAWVGIPSLVVPYQAVRKDPHAVFRAVLRFLNRTHGASRVYAHTMTLSIGHTVHRGCIHTLSHCQSDPRCGSWAFMKHGHPPEHLVHKVTISFRHQV